MKVAVIGTGSIGSRHLRLLKNLDGVEAVGISKRKGDYDALKGASHCIIASNTSCHVEDALLAWNHGCHLLVEKPLAACLEEALLLRARSEEGRQKIFVGCVLRFSESLNRFRELVSRIGLVYSVRIECQSWLPDWRPDRPYQESYSSRFDEGGVLRDLIHEIDYAGWIFGWPEGVSARLKNAGILGIEAEEMAHLWWETPAGSVVSMTLDYLSRPPRRRLLAFGSLGTLEWDGLENRVILALAGEAPQIFTPTQSRDAMYLEQLENFLGLSSHHHEPAVLEDGLKALAICDAARRSSQSRREEKVRP